MVKLGFMHIAKTAGSSVNRYFEELYGDVRCCTFAEHEVQNGATVAALFQRFDFVSGHLFFGHFARLRNEKTFTIIRNPYNHIISQMMWIYSYNYPARSKELDILPREIRDLVKIIGKFDLSSVHEMDEFLTYLPPYGVYLLNNLQSRYLIGDQSNMDALSLRDAPYVINHLEKLDYCCTLDTLQDSLPALAGRLGFDEVPFHQRVNASPDPIKIDVNSEMVRRVLQKHILVDLILYEKVSSGQVSNLI